MSLFPAYPPYSTGPYIHPMPVLHYPNYSNFIVDFEKKEYESPTLFFFKSGLAILC